MMEGISGVIVYIVSLALFEGVIKPSAEYWGNRLTNKYLPKLFDLTDLLIPERMLEGKEAVESTVLYTILRLEKEYGDRLTEQQLDSIVTAWDKKYSVLKASEKVSNHES